MSGRARRHLWLAEASRCIGCFGCEVACRMEHDLPGEARTIRVLAVGPRGRAAGAALTFLPASCGHCDRPACVAACPTGAMQKREDGIVFSDTAVCIGCQTCAVACPFGVPVLNSATGKIAKCDGCRTRVDEGLWPACALKCPTGALVFGDPARVVNELRADEASRVARAFATGGGEPA